MHARMSKDMKDVERTSADVCFTKKDVRFFEVKKPDVLFLGPFMKFTLLHYICIMFYKEWL